MYQLIYYSHYHLISNILFCSRGSNDEEMNRGRWCSCGRKWAAGMNLGRDVERVQSREGVSLILWCEWTSDVLMHRDTEQRSRLESEDSTSTVSHVVTDMCRWMIHENHQLFQKRWSYLSQKHELTQDDMKLISRSWTWVSAAEDQRRLSFLFTLIVQDRLW